MSESEPEVSPLIEQLIHARLNADLTQEQVAKRIGSTQAHLSQVESGQRSPRLELIERYARAVGARLEWWVKPREPDLATVDLAVPCPHCGHHTLCKPEGWAPGYPVVCSNPWCPSNLPPCPNGCPSTLPCPDCAPELRERGA